MLQLCRLDDLPEGSALGLELPRASILLTRVRDQVYAYLNRCPHLGVPLQWQEQELLDPERQFIRCATHGALFEKHSGLCIQGPCRGESLWQFECRVVAGFVCLDEDELPLAGSAHQPRNAP